MNAPRAEDIAWHIIRTKIDGINWIAAFVRIVFIGTLFYIQFFTIPWPDYIQHSFLGFYLLVCFFYGDALFSLIIYVLHWSSVKKAPTNQSFKQVLAEKFHDHIIDIIHEFSCELEFKHKPFAFLEKPRRSWIAIDNCPVRFVKTDRPIHLRISEVGLGGCLKFQFALSRPIILDFALELRRRRTSDNTFDIEDGNFDTEIQEFIRVNLNSNAPHIFPWRHSFHRQNTNLDARFDIWITVTSTDLILRVEGPKEKTVDYTEPLKYQCFEPKGVIIEAHANSVASRFAFEVQN